MKNLQSPLPSAAGDFDPRFRTLRDFS